MQFIGYFRALTLPFSAIPSLPAFSAGRSMPSTFYSDVLRQRARHTISGQSFGGHRSNFYYAGVSSGGGVFVWNDGRSLRASGYADDRHHCLFGVRVASAFAPSLKVFLITRALFGIAMGGEWGVGAALAFETLPAEKRGFFSGLLQEGYAVGYLMAALVYGRRSHSWDGGECS